MASTGANSSNAPSASGAIDLLMLIQKLKLTKRTGWVRKGVKDPESIADHMYRMGIMALISGEAGVDTNRCIRMAIVHDIAEAIVGDITPHCKVTPEEKYKLELEAVQRIKDMLGGSTPAAQDIESLWLEYEAGTTPEALLVKDFDKLEMIIQAHEYEQGQEGMVLQEFFDSTQGYWKTETGKRWAEELLRRREAARKQLSFWAELGG